MPLVKAVDYHTMIQSVSEIRFERVGFGGTFHECPTKSSQIGSSKLELPTKNLRIEILNTRSPDRAFSTCLELQRMPN